MLTHFYTHLTLQNTLSTCKSVPINNIYRHTLTEIIQHIQHNNIAAFIQTLQGISLILLMIAYVCALFK